MTPLPSTTALDIYFLEARSKLLDLAGVLDRIDRGGGSVAADSRHQRILQALSLLGESKLGRAERIQELFSLPYDPNWPVPQPK